MQPPVQQIPSRGNGGYIQRIDPTVSIGTMGRLVFIPPITIPFPAYNAAYAALDTFGQPFTIPVPQYGAIVDATFYDLPYQGIGKELWLARAPFTPTTDNAAFSITDADSLNFYNPITFAVFKDAAANYHGISADLPFWYYAPEGFLWGIFKTLGTDTIAAATSVPSISFTIEAYQGPM